MKTTQIDDEHFVRKCCIKMLNLAHGKDPIRRADRDMIVALLDGYLELLRSKDACAELNRRVI